jgi:hypothetical protein
VLADGEVFALRSTGNLSTGGTAVDKTDVIHPDNTDIAVRAAKVVGLDVAGIDLICRGHLEERARARRRHRRGQRRARLPHAPRADRRHAAQRGRAR